MRLMFPHSQHTRSARRTAFASAAIAVLCVMGAATYAQTGHPLWERAAIYRDEWGTPHVYAADYRAMAFAFGYAQAADHLEPMLMAYRIANGRAAEVLGEYVADSDEFALKMGHGMLARSALPNLDPLTIDLCEGFATGVNTWMAEHPGRVPDWADGVRPEDVLALWHCYLMSMAPFDLAGTYHRDPAAVSGNAWAVAPTRSRSGEAMLVINPHTSYGGAFSWYEAHLNCDGMNVAGATLFGLPVIVLGHNDVLGWALTPNKPDFADIYIESPLRIRRDPKSVNRRPLPGEEQLLQTMLLAHTQPYYVNTPAGLEERGVPCLDTSHGPVVGAKYGRMCSYQVGGYREFGGLAQLVEMARARNLGAFKAALGMRQIPCFHVLYADQQGNIFYLYNALVGDKATFVEGPGIFTASGEEPGAGPPAFVDWSTPVPAGSQAYAWGPVIPIEALPSITNPAAGYLQACGGPPWSVTYDAPFEAGDLPPWLVTDQDTHRARRVRQLLGMGRRSFRDCQSMLYDVVVPGAIEAVPQLIAFADAQPRYIARAHPDLAGGIDVLRSWNCLAETNSIGMTFFHAWWTALRRADPAALSSDHDLYAALATGAPAFQNLALGAAADAAKMMRNEFQSLSVPWGNVHTIQRGAREVALPGATSGEPIFATSDFVYDARKWRVTYGYGFAMVVSFGPRPSAVSMVPFGASENATSPHFADQLDLLAERRFKITRFDQQDIQRNASSARGRLLYLRPKGMDALFTLSAPAPIEARLKTGIDAPGTLPENLVPFSLFVKTEVAPRGAVMDTHLMMHVPDTLCAQQDLDKLALYAYTPLAGWTPLEAQELDPESRSLAALDERGPRTYAILGHRRYRPSTMTIPGALEAAQRADKPVSAPPAPSAEPQAKPLEPSSTPTLSPEERRRRRALWGRPPPHRRTPVAIPDPPDFEVDELPELGLMPGLLPESTKNEKAESATGRAMSRARRNFNLGTRSAPIDETEDKPKRERKKKKKE
ncbi:MAG: hypothetical protein GWP08_01080 [Nitrospiraceae bacterium]|nr:hypothetical protein [Nitrospiraceae bacterium]